MNQKLRLRLFYDCLNNFSARPWPAFAINTPDDQMVLVYRASHLKTFQASIPNEEPAVC